MEIINKENILTNKQILTLCNLLSADYFPKKIIIYETRMDLFKSFMISSPILFIRILLGRIEGSYLIYFDRIHIFVFSQNDDGDNLHSKQFYSLHALLHELRHRYQHLNNLFISEDDADKFATNFLNKKSKKISKIMNWEDEWEIEEED